MTVDTATHPRPPILHPTTRRPILQYCITPRPMHHYHPIPLPIIITIRRLVIVRLEAEVVTTQLVVVVTVPAALILITIVAKIIKIEIENRERVLDPDLFYTQVLEFRVRVARPIILILL